MAYTNTRDVLGDQATLDGLVAHTLSEFKENGVDRFGSAALMSNTGLVSVEMPGLSSTTQGMSAFAMCTNLVTAAFPDMKSFGTSMFYACVKLETVTAPNLTSTGNGAFYGCVALHSVAFPKLVSITGSAFNNCCALMNASFQSATSVGRSAFYNTPVAKLDLPLVMELSSNVANLAAEIDFSAKVNIVASAFTGDWNLLSLVLRNSSMCTLGNVNALASTPIASGVGHIFVPSALVDTYKAGTNWTTYASQIVSLDEYPKEVATGTITDSWADILAAEENGTYTSKYSVGDTKVLDVAGMPILMQIVAMDTDELADTTGTAKITWLALNLPFIATMNPTNTNEGGWEDCPIRSGLMQSIYDNMDSTVKAAVKSVKKTFYDFTTKSTKTTNDKVWLPSAREIFGGTSYESSGCTYTAFFTGNTQRIKKDGLLGTGSANNWWLRSAYSSNRASFGCVLSGGSSHYNNTFYSYGVAFGFCT